MKEKTTLQHLFQPIVIVAALGYFVDIYDLQLFGIVRLQSLTSLLPEGLSADEVKKIVSSAGTKILDYQMMGMILGGILWGVLGDKRGRLSVLFGSIITYSLANICCGFLPNIEFMDKIEAYKWLRFIAGLGLAGELGAGITLVSEVLPKEIRAIGTSLVAGIGLLGAVFAKFTVFFSGSWTSAYFIGGILGFALLLLRIGVVESGMFKNLAHATNIEKGNFLSFFTNRERFVKYLKCIGIGFPNWFTIGILIYFCNEFAEGLGITEKVDPGWAVMWGYVGISLGDFLSGFFSQWLKSRKMAILYMMIFAFLGFVFYLGGLPKSANGIYFMALWVGFGTGYWAMFVTVGAEQFGTNLRSTAATTIPNMSRGALVLWTFLFAGFKTGSFTIFGNEVLAIQPVGVIWAGVIVGLVSYSIALYSVLTISESHNKNLDYVE
jgi:Major Facilitator Superfamily